MLSLEEHEARLQELGIGIKLVDVDPDTASRQLKRIGTRARKALHAVMAEGAKQDGRRTADTTS